MTTKDAILMLVWSEPEHMIRGRTLLQKKLYFLSVLCKMDFGFSPHYYGPYSSLVADDLGGLVYAGFLSETRELLAARSDRTDGPHRYTYALTKDGTEVAQVVAPEMADCLRTIELINSHPVAGYVDQLAAAAKVHIILSERGKATSAEIRERARELGWNLSDRAIEAVAEYLVRLGLVETA